MKRKREKEGITTVYKVYCIHTYNVIKKRENSLRSGLVLYRYRTKYKVPVHKVLINYPRRSPRTNITLHYEGTIPVRGTPLRRRKEEVGREELDVK